MLFTIVSRSFIHACKIFPVFVQTQRKINIHSFVFRLYGSYEALKGGNVADALTDFTGGITEGYILRGPNADVPRNIVNILFKALDRQSLIGCGINVSVMINFCTDLS